MARLLLALLLLAAGSAEAMKLRLGPYSTQCVNEEATAAGDVVCVAVARTRKLCCTRTALTHGARRSSGSFVGTVKGGKKGDLFVHRTFFDLEVRRALRQRSLQPALTHWAPQITSESGEMLHQVRNRQDAKFEFVMPTSVRGARALRLRAD
jgi:hypothetical protein